jgi:hypothetical protein
MLHGNGGRGLSVVAFPSSQHEVHGLEDDIHVRQGAGTVVEPSVGLIVVGTASVVEKLVKAPIEPPSLLGAGLIRGDGRDERASSRSMATLRRRSGRNRNE